MAGAWSCRQYAGWFNWRLEGRPLQPAHLSGGDGGSELSDPTVHAGADKLVDPGLRCGGRMGASDYPAMLASAVLGRAVAICLMF
jgi:hypothetical protein